MSSANTVDLIIKLLPLITDLTPVVVASIGQIQKQSGMSLEELLATAQVQLDANEVQLLKDLGKYK